MGDTAEPGPGVFVEVIDVSNHFRGNGGRW